MIYYFVDKTITHDFNTGIQRVVRRLGKALVDNGNEVEFVKFNKKTMSIESINKNDFKYLSKWNGPIRSNSSNIRSDNDWLIVAELTNSISFGYETLDVLIAAKKINLRVAYIFYDAIPLKLKEYDTIANCHEKYMSQISMSDVVISISDYSSIDLISFLTNKYHVNNIPCIKTIHLPGETNLSSRQNALNSNIIKNNTILCVGVVVERKNQSNLIDAFNNFLNIKSENKEWRLIFVGPNVVEKLGQKSKNNTNIILVNNPSDDVLDTLYKQSTFTIYASCEEGFGLPILESMWYGKPCVCANFGSMAESSNSGCFPIDVRDNNQITAAISKLTSDSELLNTLTLEASNKVIDTWDDYSNKICSFLNEYKNHKNVFVDEIKLIEVIKTMNNLDNKPIISKKRLSDNRTVRIAVDILACESKNSSDRGVGRYSKSLFDNMLINREKCDIVNARSKDSINIDLTHISHIFEPQIEYSGYKGLISATVYDFIPLIFCDHYFKDIVFKKWYLEKIEFLKKADLLLSISESTRQDAINLIGIDPSKIITINGYVSDDFKNICDSIVICNIEKFCLKDKFILYTGGDDYRKNIETAISGFREINYELRKDYQLVIVCFICEESKTRYFEYSKSIGLNDTDVIFTGFVNEEELVALYKKCDVFIFPSLYEGLGLPILEAMYCGAPVIGGNNSSIKEIIVREDALFDSTSPSSIGLCISKVLSDNNYSDELRLYGIKRSREFSWEITSKKAINAIENTIKNNNYLLISNIVGSKIPAKKLAIFSPLPPCKSGISNYIIDFLPYLSVHFNIDIFVDRYIVDESVASRFNIYDSRRFESMSKSYDAIMYEFGNNTFHHYMIPFLKKFPGVVNLHDAYIGGMIYCLSIENFNNEMSYSHGNDFNVNDIEYSIENLPCTKSIIDHSLGIISHSRFNLDIVRKFYKSIQTPYRIIPQIISVSNEISDEEKSEIRKSLGFSDNDIILSTFGHIIPNKCFDVLIDSIQFVENRNVKLVFVGELAGKNNISAFVNSKITGYVFDEVYIKYLQITDIAVQLRKNSRGGTPKSVLDCLSFGIPVIINDHASFTDYPNDVVLKISEYMSSLELSISINLLINNKNIRESFSRLGKKYIKDNHDPIKCASEYAAAIHEFINCVPAPAVIINELSIDHINHFHLHILGRKADASTSRYLSKLIDSKKIQTTNDLSMILFARSENFKKYSYESLIEKSAEILSKYNRKT